MEHYVAKKNELAPYVLILKCVCVHQGEKETKRERKTKIGKLWGIFGGIHYD